MTIHWLQLAHDITGNTVTIWHSSSYIYLITSQSLQLAHNIACSNYSCLRTLQWLQVPGALILRWPQLNFLHCSVYRYLTPWYYSYLAPWQYSDHSYLKSSHWIQLPYDSTVTTVTLRHHIKYSYRITLQRLQLPYGITMTDVTWRYDITVTTVTW